MSEKRKIAYVMPDGEVRYVAPPISYDPARIRLEILKLLHIHSKDEQTLIDRAAKLEAYVLNGAKGEKPPT